MRISARQACADFDKALDAVERGEKVSITWNDKTIAVFRRPGRQAFTEIEASEVARNAGWPSSR